ncbi:MAG: hypothetical protein SRB1_00320 [Desulfobacteraceae bacterium Eth-SRB1]|nr:MAG: hypothetical protein SRB1_00320 [Desulfobacteraceae bacterium Eth-SRB1]
MQYKNSLNYYRLITPEVPMGFKHRWLRQAKGTVFMDNVSFIRLYFAETWGL